MQPRDRGPRPSGKSELDDAYTLGHEPSNTETPVPQLLVEGDIMERFGWTQQEFDDADYDRMLRTLALMGERERGRRKKREADAKRNRGRGRRVRARRRRR